MFLFPFIAIAVFLVLGVVFIINAAVWRKNKTASGIFVLLSMIFIGIPAITALALYFNWTSNPYDLFQTLAIAIVYILILTLIEVPLISKKLSGRYYERKIFTSVVIANTVTYLFGHTGWLQALIGYIPGNANGLYYPILGFIITVPVEILINNLILRSQYNSRDIFKLTFYSNLLSHGIGIILTIINSI